MQSRLCITFSIKSFIYSPNMIWRHYTYFSHHGKHQYLSHVLQTAYIINTGNMELRFPRRDIMLESWLVHIEITGAIKFINALSHLLFLRFNQDLPKKKTQQPEEILQKHIMLKLSYLCGLLVTVTFVSPQAVKQILSSSK